MSVNIVVPEMGESIVDARVAKWLKNEGDAVNAGDALVELETDKVDVEVSAPQAGVLAKIAHTKGADVKIGDVLGTIEAGAGAAAAKPAASPAASVTPPKAAAPSAPAPKPAASPTPAKVDAAPAKAVNGSGADVAATPSARRLAREQQVELSSVSTEGPRVTRDDVAKSIGKGEPATEKPAAAKPSTPAPAAKAPAAPVVRREPSDRTEERIRMSKRRATIARRLVEAQQTAAMLTTFNDVDMSAVMALRERQKETFKQKHGISLGLSAFFVKATVVALREFPRLNAQIDGDEMVLKHYYDIGVAVGSEEGLVVPVLRDADRLSFAEIEGAVRGFAAKVKDGTLTLEDLRGGTFSITNGGVFGSLMSTPILNPPQVGILGLHAIKDRPTGVGGQVVLRPMMYVALTYDHRIVDGSEAVRFLVRVKELVEDPGVLLIEG
jgi:2-oxoglutarate dehydrogenase E2 component (dihydrolipoamide succinyltransferase)